MKVSDIAKKKFLRSLKDPIEQKILAGVAAIRTQLPHFYMKMHGRPRLTKAKTGWRKIRFEVITPLHHAHAPPLEVINYRNHVEDLINRSFLDSQLKYTLDDVAYNDEDASGYITFIVTMWLT